MSNNHKTPTIKEQLLLSLPTALTVNWNESVTYSERLQVILAGDLDFHEHDSSYATHVIHSFPAKFPPQLPRLFIENLTCPGEIVLDPMAGSGTTLLEAYLAGRQAIGFDIDPLALRISNAKVHPLNSEQVLKTLHGILEHVKQSLQNNDETQFRLEFEATFDEETRKFIAYWFAPEVYRILFYLKKEINQILDTTLRNFFEVAFSSLIITKNGGVSFALDLAHTRPHRAKIVYDEHGGEILHDTSSNISPARLKILTKTLRPVLPEFEKRVRNNLRGEFGTDLNTTHPYVAAGNAQQISLGDNSVDLIVTSPPYAANAIDYMRAHKFSLVWFGYPISNLSEYRHQYIGDELPTPTENLFPVSVQHILDALGEKDKSKMLSVQRYYLEMKNVLAEIYRVLRPGKAAILIVGTSVIRGIDICIGDSLAEIGKEVGFNVPAIGIRNIDRDRRMLPVGNKHDETSQIQQRMQKEYVVGFYKPDRKD
jgi:DNA modification methylase